MTDLFAFINPFNEEWSDSQIEEAMEENVRLGFMEHAGIGEDGEQRYRMTEAGTREVEKILGELRNQS